MAACCVHACVYKLNFSFKVSSGGMDIQILANLYNERLDPDCGGGCVTEYIY